MHNLKTNNGMISADMIVISVKQLAVVKACKCIIKGMNGS